MLKKIVLLTALVSISQISVGAGMHTETEVLDYEQHGGKGAVFKLRMPENIPLNNVVECDFYNRDYRSIANTRKVVQTRIVEFSVKVYAPLVRMVMCSVP